jgi:hypothetical protein
MVAEDWSPIKNAVITKSSMEMAKAIMRLAQMAGVSMGTSTILIACHCDAPRSMAASSYSLPIANRRPRTIITT